MSEELPTNDWFELDAAQASEPAYQKFLRGESFACTSQALKRAEKDALRAMSREIPDAEEFARWLETASPPVAQVLKSAWVGKSPPYSGCLRVDDCEHAATLRSLGLIGWIGKDRDAGFAVRNFGNSVRKFMLGKLGETEGEA